MVKASDLGEHPMSPRLGSMLQGCSLQVQQHQAARYGCLIAQPSSPQELIMQESRAYLEDATRLR